MELIDVTAVLHVEILAHHVIHLGLVASGNLGAVNLLMKHLVSWIDVLSEGIHLTFLFFSHLISITIQVVVLHFCKCLCTLVIALTSHFARLLNCIHTENVKVSLLSQLLFVG